MSFYRYVLNAHRVSPTKHAPFLDYAARTVSGLLVTPERIVRVALHWTAPVLFECHANDVLAADRLFRAATDINPAARPDIGCQVNP